MYEQEYLADADVTAFISFLRGLIIEGHPAVSFRVGSGRGRRQVSTLIEGFEAYRWRGETYAAIDGKLERMRREMLTALEQCAAATDQAERRLAELELLFVSTKALSLGRVYEGAFPFLIHQAETGVLSENLRLAAALIDGAVEEVSAFDDRPYRSDCAMTKVYSLMNRRTVVYDDRLGAAMGLLCRIHLERERRTSVPELLAFMVGDRGNVRRDPSRGGFRFPDKHSGREHARWNIRANWIVSRVAAAPEAVVLGSELRDRIRRIEAALFVLGDDVHDQPRMPPHTIASPAARIPRHAAVPLPAVGGGESS